MSWLFHVLTLIKATDACCKSLKMAHQCDHVIAPLPLPPLITCRIRHRALFRDLEMYKLSTGDVTY